MTSSYDQAEKNENSFTQKADFNALTGILAEHCKQALNTKQRKSVSKQTLYMYVTGQHVHSIRRIFGKHFIL